MNYSLDLNVVPTYLHSAFKYFQQGEKHVSRICNEEVLIIMISGQLNFNENGVAVSLKNGQYYIQRRGLYQMSNIPSSDAVYYYVHFHGCFTLEKTGIPVLGNINYDSVAHMVEKLDRHRRSDDSKTEKAAAFLSILSFFAQQKTYYEKQKIVSNIAFAVSENLNAKYTLAELAKMAGYSKNQTIRIFKTQTGKTPYEYVLKIRLEAARQMLENSDYAIESIAEKTGFDTYINLYKAFVKMYDCTPTVWREKTRSI